MINKVIVTKYAFVFLVVALIITVVFVGRHNSTGRVEDMNDCAIETNEEMNEAGGKLDNVYKKELQASVRIKTYK